MRRSELLSGLACGALALGGCALEPGDPWGEVEVGLTVGLGGVAGRLDEAGRVRTLRNYRVEIVRLGVDVATVELVAGADAVANFDPANPPAGYSNCHNGHCHHDDGRLVDYADIAAELAGGAVGAQTLGALAGSAVDIAGVSQAGVPLGDCEGDGASAGGSRAACVLEAPGTVAVARASLRALTLQGRFFDGVSGDRARLPPEGVAFEVALAAAPEDAVWRGTTQVAETFGPGLAASRRVDLALRLDAAAFDGIDAAAFEADPAALGEAVAAQLEAFVSLSRGED